MKTDDDDVKGEEKWFHGPVELDKLAMADEADLRAMGAGYRAPYLKKSAQEAVSRGGRSWLAQLADASKDREKAKEELMVLHGVGPKVADCILLYGLNKVDACPVDVHVHAVAARAGVVPSGSKPSLASSQKISEAFRTAFGKYAGWAQAIMFTSDLANSKVKTTAIDEPN